MGIATMLVCTPALAQVIFNSAGTSLVSSGNVSIVIQNGGIQNDGGFIKGKSTVIFTGNSATSNSFVSGSSPADFYNFTVNKTAKGVQLNTDISISNTLKMQSGDSLFLNNHNIDLGSTGAISGEINSRRITGLTGGYIRANAILDVATAANPGNLGLQITSPVNLGNTVIKRFCKRPAVNCINRYFEIIPAHNAGLNATLTCYYFDAELNGISEWDLNLHSSLDSGAFWVLDGKTDMSTSLNFVTMNLYNKLQLVTLADIYLTLPVSSLNLKAYLQNKQIVIEWTGAYNANNSAYEIERSVNGREFAVIGTVRQQSGYNSVNYSFTDPQPVSGFNYYRLKQFANDNRVLCSGITRVQYDPSADATAITYPNPAHGQAKTIVTATAEKDIKIMLFDNSHKPVLVKNIHLLKGCNEIVWDITRLPAGCYYVGTTDGYLRSEKLVKQ